MRAQKGTMFLPASDTKIINKCSQKIVYLWLYAGLDLGLGLGLGLGLL